MSTTTATRQRPSSLGDTLDHPQIFGPHFGGASWQPWRVFLKSLFALPLTDDELAVFQHHTERSTEPTDPFREVALVVGRRGGKSRILALIAVYLVLRFAITVTYLAALVCAGRHGVA
jgi:hypothetical protein